MTPITRRQALSLFPVPLFGARSKKKNVLVLMTDEHQHQGFSIANHPIARTPNLDALARTSMRFDNAYCTSPVCVPSRFSYMTGVYPHRGQVWGNTHPWPAEFKTIGDYFTAAGYRTANIGKLHAVSRGNHGFEEYIDHEEWFASIGPEKARIFQQETALKTKDGRKGPLPVGRMSLLAEEDHFESFVARESIRFLKQHKSEPFLLVSSFVKPHDPFMPAKRWFNMFPRESVKLPDTWGKLDLATVPRFIKHMVEASPVTPELLDPEQARMRVACYYANLAQADDCIGKVLGTLSELGLDDDTIVMYLADHGDMAGDKGLWLKFIMYENSVGVPLMFRVPGMTSGGSRSATIASLTQVLPTLAELCGVDIPSKLDGQSAVRSLRNPQERFDTAAYSEIDMLSQTSKQMFRRGDYKYCYNGVDMEQLYDMRRDPLEMTNLALDRKYKDTVQKLKAELIGTFDPATVVRGGKKS
jgi:choline-sulfatase